MYGTEHVCTEHTRVVMTKKAQKHDVCLALLDFYQRRLVLGLFLGPGCPSVIYHLKTGERECFLGECGGEREETEVKPRGIFKSQVE